MSSEDAADAWVRIVEKDIDAVAAKCGAENRLLQAEIDNLREDFGEMKVAVEQRVPLSRYLIVERVVFAMMALIAIAVIGQIVNDALQGGATP